MSDNFNMYDQANQQGNPNIPPMPPMEEKKGMSIASIMISNPMLLVLTLLFLVLLVPYIMHYYTLENEVQKMYTQYDEILKRLE